MKKKSAGKGVIPRQESKSRPAKVGGRKDVSGQVNWSRVGRRRLADNEAIHELAGSLKAAREKAGVSVTQLAKQLKIAPATLIKFEDKGYPISVKVVLAVASKLGCSLVLKEPGRKAR